MSSKNLPLALVLAPLLTACAAKGLIATSTSTSTSPGPHLSPAPATTGSSTGNAPAVNADDDWQSQPETDAHWATYDGVRVIEKPGPRPALRSANCDAAHDHCLHSNTWFVTYPQEDPKRHVRLTFRFEGRFYSWDDEDERTDGTAYLTVAANPALVKVGDKVIAFNEDLADLSVPASPSRARDDRSWHLLEIVSIDPARRTFRTAAGQADIPLAVTRVIVETVEVSP